MKNQLIDIVLRDNVISLARVLEDMGPTLIVQLLKKNKKEVYEFAEYPEEIPMILKRLDFISRLNMDMKKYLKVILIMNQVKQIVRNLKT